MNKIAFYIRLSVEDSKTDSLSIDGQRKLLYSNLNKYPEYTDCEVVEFIDNGHTGTNFERPKMQELLSLVQENKISCIFVKDFSRFGRDLLQTGYFLEKVFPLFMTRFVAIDDLYDSSNYEEDTGGLDITFKYLISEYYSQDLSVKSLAARHSKMKSGKYQSTNCPYGYQKGENGRMVPDVETKSVVELIFDLALKDFKTKEIVNELYKRKIMTPGEYKASKGKFYHDLSKTKGIWTTSQVRRMLKDERYTGVYIMGKQEVVSVGSRNVKAVDESKWYKIPDHHEAIISKEVYEEVQSKLRTFKCPRVNKNVYPLKSTVVCGVCGHTMQKVFYKNKFYTCRHTTGIEDYPCNGLKIYESDIHNTIMDITKKQAEIILNASDTFDFENLQKDDENVSELQKKIDSLNTKKRNLYSGYFDKEISLEEYKSGKAKIDKELFPLTSSHTKLKEHTDNLKRTQKEQKNRQSIANDILNANELTMDIAELLIEKVLIYPNNQMEIVFKLNDFIG